MSYKERYGFVWTSAPIPPMRAFLMRDKCPNLPYVVQCTRLWLYAKNKTFIRKRLFAKDIFINFRLVKIVLFKSQLEIGKDITNEIYVEV